MHEFADNGRGGDPKILQTSYVHVHMAPNDNVAFNNSSLNYTLFFPLSKNAKGGRRGRSTSRPAIKRARKDTSRREDLSVTPRDRSGVRDAEQVDKLKTTSKKMQVRYIKFIYACRVFQNPKRSEMSVF